MCPGLYGPGVCVLVNGLLDIEYIYAEPKEPGWVFWPARPFAFMHIFVSFILYIFTLYKINFYLLILKKNVVPFCTYTIGSWISKGLRTMEPVV